MKSESFRDNQTLLELLELCIAHSEDDFGNNLYKFENENVSAILDYSKNDGDTSISLFVSGQAEPIVEVRLIGSKDVKVVYDSKAAYLEFAGQMVDEVFSRGSVHKTFGFRFWLKPVLRVEPYYIGSTEGQ